MSHGLSKMGNCCGQPIYLVPRRTPRRTLSITQVVFSRLASQVGVHPPPVYDIWAGQAAISEPTKQAFVSYTASPLRLSVDDNRNVQFSNTGIERTIVTMSRLESRPAPQED